MGNVVVEEEFDASQMPSDLAAAATLLSKLAHGGYSPEWEDCSEIDALQAQRQAVVICFERLGEISNILDQSILSRSAYLQSQTEAIKSLLPSNSALN